MKLFYPPFFRTFFFLSLLLLTISCGKIQEMYESKNDSQLAKAKNWLEQIPQIGVRAILSTSWREGKMYYIFNVNPIIDPTVGLENKSVDFNKKAILSQLFLNKLEAGYGIPIFTVQMTDKAGFAIISIERTGAIRIVDDENKYLGLRVNSSIECSRKKYRDITGWDITWRP